jgi:hypothetical protein
VTVKGKPWSDREVRYLRTHYGRMPTRDIATTLGRTLGAVKNFVHLHDIGSNVGRNWSAQDDAFLRSYYGVMPTQDIASKLRRTCDAVRLRASHMGIAAELRESVDDRTAMTWAKVLGVTHGAVNNWICRGALSLDEEFDEPYLRTRVISEDTMEMWLRQGGAIRCKPHADTPHYWARIIAEVKAQYISATELRDIDPFFYPAHMWRKHGMGTVKASPILCGSQHGHDSYYKKTEIYDAIYCVGHLVPRHVKDPYIKAIVMAWESVYVATWELAKHFKVRISKGFPKPIIRGVYNRAEIVAWLKTRPSLARFAHVLRQDPICYKELHRDLDRKAQRGGAR